MNHRTSVRLDVHARSVVMCGLDGESGELFERRLTPEHREFVEWVRSLPGPAQVVYEVGPNRVRSGQVPARGRDVCLVAAPSKLGRPAGDRVKADVRDARHLARLLHLGEIVAVTVPSIEREAARDLVWAREDVRGDLMSARHRVSKLLLRQRIVHSDRKSWTGKTQGVSRTHTFSAPGLQLAYDTAFDAVLATVDRRNRLDEAIGQMAAGSTSTPVVTWLGCLRGISTFKPRSNLRKILDARLAVEVPLRVNRLASRRLFGRISVQCVSTHSALASSDPTPPKNVTVAIAAPGTQCRRRSAYAGPRRLPGPHVRPRRAHGRYSGRATRSSGWRDPRPMRPGRPGTVCR